MGSVAVRIVPALPIAGKVRQPSPPQPALPRHDMGESASTPPGDEPMRKLYERPPAGV
jgi:hypothetical protein